MVIKIREICPKRGQGDWWEGFMEKIRECILGV